MLLFRVARSLYKESGTRRSRSVKRLLSSALELLYPELSSEVRVAACWLLGPSSAAESRVNC